jgi:hypothetical protein
MSALGILHSTNPNTPTDLVAIMPLGTTSFILTPVTNFSITFLIVGRIYYIGYGPDLFRRHHQKDLTTQDDEVHAMMQSTARHIRGAVSIVIESGALYIIQFIFVVVFGVGNVSQAILGPIGAQTFVSRLSSLLFTIVFFCSCGY